MSGLDAISLVGFLMLVVGGYIAFVELPASFVWFYGSLVTAVAGLVLLVGGICAAVNIVNEERRDAIDTIAANHDVTIDDPGRYSRKPSDWMIDGVWRDCYLSTDDMAKAAEADLMCETPIDGQAPYTKVGATE